MGNLVPLDKGETPMNLLHKVNPELAKAGRHSDEAIIQAKTPHDCWDYAVSYKSKRGRIFGYGWECDICGHYLWLATGQLGKV
jgi:hypothetical protein